jgi:hypothetical protein
VTAAVNIHDTVLFPDSFKKLTNTAEKFGISLKGIPLTLDSGFDSEKNNELILQAEMIPVIKPNFRNTKNKKIIKERTRIFKKIEKTYILRHTAERGFAWEDKYRKLVIRYERLQSTFNGFRYLAGAMVNYRTEFGKKPL